MVKVYPVVINHSVFGASVVSVTIDGQERKFVGSVTDASPSAHWIGKDGSILKGGAAIDIGREPVFALITTTNFSTRSRLPMGQSW